MAGQGGQGSCSSGGGGQGCPAQRTQRRVRWDGEHMQEPGCRGVLVSSAKWPTGMGQSDGAAESSQRQMEPVPGDSAQGLGLASAVLGSSRNHSSDHVPVSSKLWSTCPPARGSITVSHMHVLLTGPGHK